MDFLEQTITQTVTIGSSGDYQSINAALEALSKQRPIYNSSSQISVKINLLSGFVMAEQVVIRDGLDLGWIEIISVDPVVSVDRSALTEITVDDSYAAFTAWNNARLPIIGTVFDMDTSGTETQRDGIVTVQNSSVSTRPFCGLINAGRDCLSIQKESHAAAHQFIGTGAGRYAVYCSRRSSADTAASDLKNAVSAAIFCDRVSSVGSTSGTDASGSGVGVLVKGAARVCVPGINVSNCTSAGIHALEAATVEASLADASGAGGNGIRSQGGAVINAEGANAQKGASQSGSDFVITNGGTINAIGGIGGTNVPVNEQSNKGIIYK